MNTRKLIYIALFVAIGITLPQIFHLIGGNTAGSIFLPMQLPLFIGAMLLGPIAGVLIAVLTVGLGVMLGMPPLLIGVFMTIEMAVYGLVSGYLYKNKKINIYVSLLIAKILGMAAMLFSINIALNLSSIMLPPLFGKLSMFTASIPGIVIQFIIIPILLVRLETVNDIKQMN